MFAAVSDRSDPFQLKGSSFQLLVLKIIDPSDERFFTHLASRVRSAPSLFRGAPVVLDLSDPGIELDRIDLSSFTQRVRDQGLIPVAATGAPRESHEAIIRAGLSILSGGRPARVPEPAPEPEPPPPPPPAPARNTVVVTEPVRSGRRIYSNGDLIVLAPVSQGAELLADGHIHIYSSLRGRALAGLNGDRSARIFCQNIQAELVSIAGLYRVSEDLDRKIFKKSVQIHLVADRLCVEVLP